jgi:hypothetical protein
MSAFRLLACSDFQAQTKTAIGQEIAVINQGWAAWLMGVAANLDLSAVA